MTACRNRVSDHLVYNRGIFFPNHDRVPSVRYAIIMPGSKDALVGRQTSLASIRYELCDLVAVNFPDEKKSNC
jgi:hypothetical protein